MSRRDTIIVAVLINAGLLIILFASALKSSSVQEEFVAVPKVVQTQAAAAPAKPKSLNTIGDEVDQALNQYANAPVAKAEPIIATSPQVEPAVVQPFVEEFKLVAVAEEKPVAVVPRAPIAVEKALSDVKEYRVKKGDMLEKIARNYHCSVEQIMTLNQLSTTNLRIGQLLKIPAASPSTAKEAPALQITAQKDEAPKYYIVKNGDNPWTIAVKNHLKVDELLKLNDLNEEKARRLKPGDQLRIR
ncbi:MAG: LysM peptidoglycan-binding domain-containing protein [Rhabdochlamydiaceae bacterium]|nr:LysM peptidoglycan-binding domain-containing protein [Rhabdochlamydiaceae bacterium]